MLGLVNSAKQLRNLACKRVNLTIQFSTGTPVQVSFYWWCMWMILLSLGVTLQESHPLSPLFTANCIQRTYGCLDIYWELKLCGVNMEFSSLKGIV